MAKYSPTFGQPLKGKFHPDSAIYSMNIGSNAYVTEREMNEIQWLRIHEVADLIRNMTFSGVLMNSNDKENEFEAVLSNKPNEFELENFRSVIDGFILDNTAYQNGEKTRIKVELPNPPVARTRRDVVAVEMFFKELKGNDKPYMYGGMTNDVISDYNIIDERIEEETSRRIQLWWRIAVFEDRECTYIDGFRDEEGNINPEIFPLKDTYYAAFNAKYRLSEHDEHLYIADNVPNTVDNKCYAIPLMLVTRLNNSGYSEQNNPYGGIDYDDENTVPDRPDNKFSNIIYPEQIQYVFYSSSLGRTQYDKIYCTIQKFYEHETLLRNRLYSISYQFENVASALRKLGYSLPGIYDKQLYGHTMFRQQGLTMGAVKLNKEKKIMYRKQGYSVGRELMDKPYAVVPSVISSDYDVFGSIGDIYIEKEPRKFYIYNTGSKGLKMDISALLVDNNVVYSGTGTFSGMDGTSIELPFEIQDNRHFVHIMPTENMNACVGEIYVKFVEREIIVYNTGYNPEIARKTATSSFQWTVIDTFNENLVNFVMDTVKLNGQKGKVINNNNFGDNYHFLLGTPVIMPDESVPEGSIGEFYSDTDSENSVTIFNTGEPGISVQYLIFNEIPYLEYYDYELPDELYDGKNIISYELPKIKILDKE